MISGIASSGLPIRKCPVVRISIPSSEWDMTGTKGLLLMQDSTRQRTVDISSQKSMVSPVVLCSNVFTDLMVDSHNPPKWGAHSGEKYNLMPAVVQKSRMSHRLSLSCKQS